MPLDVGQYSQGSHNSGRQQEEQHVADKQVGNGALQDDLKSRPDHAPPSHPIAYNETNIQNRWIRPLLDATLPTTK